MTDPILLPDGSPAGWWVKDPDGNVIQSGPSIDLVLLSDDPDSGLANN